jgi:hypothetical protein
MDINDNVIKRKREDENEIQDNPIENIKMEDENIYQPSDKKLKIEDNCQQKLVECENQIYQLKNSKNKIDINYELGISIRDEQQKIALNLQKQLNQNNILLKCNDPLMESYKASYKNQQSNTQPVADPTKCFTYYDINYQPLLDELKLNNMTYYWRVKDSSIVPQQTKKKQIPTKSDKTKTVKSKKNEKTTTVKATKATKVVKTPKKAKKGGAQNQLQPKFGICGNLEIAGLTILAMKVTKVITEYILKTTIKEFIKKFYKNLFENISEYDNNYDTLFNNAFKKVQNRESLDGDDCQNLTTEMLNVLNSIQIIVNDNRIDKNNMNDTISYNFLNESQILLTKILLTKSSLDVCQATVLTSLLDTNSFCLFNSYDFSAVVNTPSIPVMGAAKFQGLNTEINFIFDNILIMIFILFLTEYKNKSDTNTILGITLNEANKIIIVNFIKVYDVIENADVSNNSESQKKFHDLMNMAIDNSDLLFVNELNNIVEKQDISNFIINKNIYEKISRLFLNYSIINNKVNTFELTKNSRDIRAHDYTNSSIRCYGIAVFIKLKFAEYLNSNNKLLLDNLWQIDKFILEKIKEKQNITTYIDDFVINFLECSNTAKLINYFLRLFTLARISNSH